MNREISGEKYPAKGISPALKKLLFCISLLGSLSLEAGQKDVETIFYTKGAMQTHDPEQSLDLYPGPTEEGPVLVFVHGGAWVSGDKRDYLSLAQNFQPNTAVAIINYRLSPAVKHPTHVEDLIAALGKIKSSKIFLAGHSAGAFNIAFLAAKGLSPELERKIAGFIGLEGIYNLPQLAIRWPGYRDWFLRSAFGDETSPDNAKSWKNISPALLRFKILAPWLIVHSETDELVDTGQSLDFYKHLQTQKIEAKYFIIKKASHFGVVGELTKSASPLTQEIKAFMQTAKP